MARVRWVCDIILRCECRFRVEPEEYDDLDILDVLSCERHGNQEIVKMMRRGR